MVANMKKYKYKFCKACKRFGVSYKKLSKKKAGIYKGIEKCRYCGETSWK